MPGKVASDILKGAREAAALMQGKPIKTRTHHFADVKRLRKKLDMTQREFSETFGFSLDTIKHWEAGRRTPEYPAQLLLRVIEKHPNAVLSVV